MPGGNAVPTAAQGASGQYGGGHMMRPGHTMGGAIGAPLMSGLPMLPGQALASTPVPFVPRRRDGPAPAINPNPTIVGGKRKYDDNPTGAGMLGMGRVRIRTARARSTVHVPCVYRARATRAAHVPHRARGCITRMHMHMHVLYMRMRTHMHRCAAIGSAAGATWGQDAVRRPARRRPARRRRAAAACL